MNPNTWFECAQFVRAAAGDFERERIDRERRERLHRAAVVRRRKRKRGGKK